MKKFNEFDESIKHKMDGMNFQFNEANWEKMSQMIDASRPVKKPFASVPLISSIIIGSVLVISSVWYLASDSSSNKEIAQKSKTAIAESNYSINNEDAAVISTISNKNTTDNNSTISNDNNISSHSSNNNSVASRDIERNELAANNENALTYASEKKDEVKIAKKDNSNDDNNIIASNENAKQKITNMDLPIGKIEGAKQKGNNNNGNINTEASIVNASNNNTSASTEINNVTEKQEADQPMVSIDEESTLETMPTMTTNLGQTAETIAAANLKTATLEEKKAWEYVRVKHHTFSIEGGAINSFGWAVNKTRNGNNLSPVLGVNYMYNIDSRSSLLFGLQYNNLANLGQAKVDFSVTTYGFGVNNDVTTYKLTDLHYAVMPIKYIHRMNKNNALGFGANMMYLMNTRTMITKTKMVENNISTSSSDYEMGYGFDQLNLFNTQLAVSYHHNISNKLAMNIELNKTLMNVVKNYKYFGAKNTSSAPAAIKLSLTYTLFNK